MRIANIKLNTYKPINFGTSQRTIYKAENGDTFVRSFYDKKMDFIGEQGGQILCSNTTEFFRGDIFEIKLAKRLDELFSNGEKVNVHNFACSDGSEAYSLAISLIEELGEEKAKRFFPIKATDIDPYIIEEAKSGRVFADDGDMAELINRTNNNIKKYFNITEVTDGYILEAKDILKNNIEFSKEDFLNGLNNIKEKENNLILCRNFWAYLGEKEIMDCARKLHKKLNENSIVIIGRFDMNFGEPPPFLTELNIDWATDYFGEECILKKYPYNENSEYDDINYVKNQIRLYKKRKLDKKFS